MRRALMSLAAFAVAVYTFSVLWGAARAAWEGHPTLPPGPFLASVAAFVGALGYLAFVVYAADRAAGRVRRRIGAFDRLLDRGSRG
ncbi:MAG TPA: hypothetical protein VGR25_03525 [bacterium]|jgi:hypothetical protein|nr:hypothetical protein [bacterium]